MTRRAGYIVNEVFYSLQGEGVRAGTPNVFVRFAGCNLTCKAETHGFDCDTEFTSGLAVPTPEALVAAALATLPDAAAVALRRQAHVVGVIFTGGEPALQLDRAAVKAFSQAGFLTAIETNGTHEVDALDLDWICVSPKVAEHAVRQRACDEVKYVRHPGQTVPHTLAIARTGRPLHCLLSPAAGPEGIRPATLAWCIQLCKDHPPWRLSVQQHKAWGVR